MYPVIKLASTLIKAAFSSKIKPEDKSVLTYRAGITDIDMFFELNNARYFTYMEMARWDFSYRVGLLSLMKKHKWGVTIGGASVRYRRRIPAFSKFTVTTEMVCHDDRWYYFLQEMHIGDKICFSGLIKACVTSKNGLVEAIQVNEKMGRADWNPKVPDWIKAWIEAEGQRPWPKA